VALQSKGRSQGEGAVRTQEGQGLVFIGASGGQARGARTPRERKRRGRSSMAMTGGRYQRGGETEGTRLNVPSRIRGKQCGGAAGEERAGARPHGRQTSAGAVRRRTDSSPMRLREGR
jgi:hypothetical protein